MIEFGNGAGFIPAPYSCTFHDPYLKDKSGRCKPCRNAVERARHKKNRETRVEYDTTCGVCGGPRITGMHCERCVYENAKVSHQRNHDKVLSDQYRWRADNRDAWNAMVRKSYNANPVNAIKKRAYKIANKERYAALDAKRRIENPEAVRSYYHKHRAFRRGVPGKFTKDQLVLLKLLLGQRCFDCGEVTKLEVGHATPICRGGSNWIDNIVPQCRSCNATQASKIHPEFEIPANPLVDFGLVIFERD